MKTKNITKILGVFLIVLGIGGCVVGANTHSGGNLEALGPLMFGLICLIAGFSILTINLTLGILDRRAINHEEIPGEDGSDKLKAKLIKILVVIVFTYFIGLLSDPWALDNVVHLFRNYFVHILVYIALLNFIYQGFQLARVLMLFFLASGVILGIFSLSEFLEDPSELIRRLIIIIGYTYCAYIIFSDKDIIQRINERGNDNGKIKKDDEDFV